MTLNIQAINQRMQRIARRAERVEEELLEDTFVGVAGIENIVYNPENQIISGRRGTGKTHALKFLQRKAQTAGQIGVFVDLRLLGSEGSIYSSSTVPLEERVSRLVADFFGAIHEGLYEAATNPNGLVDLGTIGEGLDALAAAISRIFVEVSSETLEAETTEREEKDQRGAKLSAGASGLGAQVQAGGHTQERESTRREKIRRGRNQIVVHFATVSNAMRTIVRAGRRRLWVFVDEWSSIPGELQPYLADVLRRVLFPISDATIVIAAIEHRSQFQIGVGGAYTGIEVGADCATSINLDDFMVFDNNPAKAREFFSAMVFRHLTNVEAADLLPLDARGEKDLIKSAFTPKTFDELIRAAEGVPRDAINILSLAARRANAAKITIRDLRYAAGQWFEQDKSRFLRQNREAEILLAWVVDKVLGEKRARAFLVETGIRHNNLDELYDGRVLHILKRSVSAHDQPGKRYTVYKIDYGCYVDLLTTARAPQGTLPGIDEVGAESFVEVPPDDYRSIRRSILDVRLFNYEQMRQRIENATKGKTEGSWNSFLHIILEDTHLRFSGADFKKS